MFTFDHPLLDVFPLTLADLLAAADPVAERILRRAGALCVWRSERRTTCLEAADDADLGTPLSPPAGLRAVDLWRALLTEEPEWFDGFYLGNLMPESREWRRMWSPLTHQPPSDVPVSGAWGRIVTQALRRQPRALDRRELLALALAELRPAAHMHTWYMDGLWTLAETRNGLLASAAEAFPDGLGDRIPQAVETATVRGDDGSAGISVACQLARWVAERPATYDDRETDHPLREVVEAWPRLTPEERDAPARTLSRLGKLPVGTRVPWPLGLAARRLATEDPGRVIQHWNDYAGLNDTLRECFGTVENFVCLLAADYRLSFPRFSRHSEIRRNPPPSRL